MESTDQQIRRREGAGQIMTETSDLFNRISTHYERRSQLLSGEGIQGRYDFAI
jgi:hypothetical protein